MLCSAGLDSVVLLADEAARGGRVVPVYVGAGLWWEAAELAQLDSILASDALAGVARPQRLTFPMQDVYPPTHWALVGKPPAYDTPDADVYIVGRNVTLIAKAAVFCATARLHRIALGLLSANPFPDSTEEFFAAIARALSIGLDWTLVVDAPFRGVRKADVIRRGIELGVPLELTVSCMRPEAAVHCGRCSKCRERQQAFREAGVPDATRYAAAAR